MDNLCIPRRIIIEGKVIIFYTNPITGKVYINKREVEPFNELIPSLFTHLVEINISDICSGYTPKIEVYSIDTLEDDLFFIFESSTVSELIASSVRNTIKEVRNSLKSMSMDSHLISQKSLKVLNQMMQLKQKEILVVVDLRPKEILGRMDTLFREKFNIRMREELPSLYFLTAMKFILELEPNSLVGDAYAKREK